MKLAELQQFLHALPEQTQESIVTPPLVDASVEYFKQLVDEYRFIDASVSVEIANQIIAMGICEANLSYQALGHMAKGDSLAHQGKMDAAWDELKLAESLYLKDENEVGWARTRIGLINVANSKGKTFRDAILQDVPRAHDILIEHGLIGKSIVLSNNTAASYHSTGEHHKALETFETLLTQVRAQDDTIQRLYMGMIYENIAVTYAYLGQNRQSLDAREQAQHHFLLNNQVEAMLRSQINSAMILRRLGYHVQAIRLLREAIDTEWYALQDAGERLLAEKGLIVCYLEVGKFRQALHIAQNLHEAFAAWGNQTDRLEVLIYLAIAEAELHRYTDALKTLAHAQQIADELKATFRMGEIHGMRSKIYLAQGYTERVLNEVDVALTYLPPDKNRYESASLLLAKSRYYAHTENYSAARACLAQLFEIAEREQLPALQVEGHLLVGQIHQTLGEFADAVSNYQAATTIVEHTQQTLTLTLRSDFLGKHHQAHRHLVAHYLRQNQPTEAFHAIEKLKAQLYLSYLIQHDQLRWQGDGRSQHHQSQLHRLREAFHEQDTAPAAERDPDTLANIAKQIESLREHLYLTTEDSGHVIAAAPTLDEIRDKLRETELVIVYYESESIYYAILITRTAVECVSLGEVATCQRLINQCYLNFDAVLRSNLQHLNTTAYVKAVQAVLEKLYELLMSPFQRWLEAATKLWIVPYGGLHQLPFGCLYHSECYLIQQFEIALLPYTGHLTLHNHSKLARGATVLAHSYHNHVPLRLDEGQMVADLFHTLCHQETEAQRELIYQARGQLLHIAAHAHFYLDHPDLSYIQLGDGKLYVDDLFQNEMPLELVVLSACETGKARVAPGDELLGLGRGFLYSGVKSLVVSLWRVADVYTYRLMTYFYEALHEPSHSKSKALQQAQCRLLREEPDLHPVFWGAFQFIGDSRPLTIS